MYKKKFYRINHNIQANQIRVLDEQGHQVGVMSVGDGLRIAVEQGIDLVEIVPRAVPPVCKLIDFKKFLYLEEKKDSLERKKNKRTDQKEIWLAPFIAENDLNTRIKQSRKFLEEGNKVKIVVKFKGREIAKKDFGVRVVAKVTEKLADIARTEAEPRFLGNRLEVLYNPTGKIKKTE